MVVWVFTHRFFLLQVSLQWIHLVILPFACWISSIFSSYHHSHYSHEDWQRKKQVLPVWERSTPPSALPPLPQSVSLAGLLRAEGLCADVPGERPAPLPWENMWSGSVYAGTLSSSLPHSMLASLSQMTMLKPPPTKGAFSGWGDTSNYVGKQEIQQVNTKTVSYW